MCVCRVLNFVTVVVNVYPVKGLAKLESVLGENVEVFVWLHQFEGRTCNGPVTLRNGRDWDFRLCVKIVTGKGRISGKLSHRFSQLLPNIFHSVRPVEVGVINSSLSVFFFVKKNCSLQYMTHILHTFSFKTALFETHSNISKHSKC